MKITQDVRDYANKKRDENFFSKFALDAEEGGNTYYILPANKEEFSRIATKTGKVNAKIVKDNFIEDIIYNPADESWKSAYKNAKIYSFVLEDGIAEEMQKMSQKFKELGSNVYIEGSKKTA